MAPPQTLPANFVGWDKPPATLPKDFDKWDEGQPAGQQRSFMDKLANDPNDIRLDSYLHATEYGLANIGKGAAQAVQGVGQLIRHPIDTLKGTGSGLKQLPSQAVALAKSPPTLKDVGDVSGEMAGNLVTGIIGGEAIGALPKIPGAVTDTFAPGSRMDAAGKLFQQAMAKAKNQPVALENSQNGILRLMDWQKKAQLGPTINKFLNRVTNPKMGAMTYEEARDYYKLLGKLSSDETSKLAPSIQRDLAKTVSGFKADIQSAANQAGAGSEHARAMFEFAKGARQAERLNKVREIGTKAAITSGIGAVGGAGGAAGWEIYRALRD